MLYIEHYPIGASIGIDKVAVVVLLSLRIAKMEAGERGSRRGRLDEPRSTQAALDLVDENAQPHRAALGSMVAGQLLESHLYHEFTLLGERGSATFTDHQPELSEHSPDRQAISELRALAPRLVAKAGLRRLAAVATCYPIANGCSPNRPDVLGRCIRL